MKRLLRLHVLMALVALGGTQATAQNLLTAGDFEPPGGVGEVPGWTLDEFVTGSATELNTGEIVGFDPFSGSNDLWLRSFVGGEDPGPDNLTNAVLFQEVPVTGGEAYTFTGYSRWEDNYSGGVATLDAGSPLGAVASPTQTNMKIEFLDGGGGVVGSPTVLDLTTEQGNFNFWIQHTLNGTAPATAVSARVTAEARDMVFNMNPLQSAFFDTFSFTADTDPGTELLSNPDLEEGPPSALDFWDVVQDDPGNPDNDEIIRDGFAFSNNTPGGSSGVWFSSFFGEAGTEVDGSLSQTVAGVAGETYSFSGFSRFEPNYSGGDALQPTETFMELAFLDGSDAVIGTPVELDVRAARELITGGSANDDMWYEHELTGVAPAGTASVRVTAGMIDGLSTSGAQSMFFDDFVLEIVTAGVPGDIDDDGDVDVADGLAAQRNGGSDFTDWLANFPTPAPVAAVGAVPEPSTAVGLMLAAATAAFLRRRVEKA